MKCRSVACIWSGTPPTHRVTATAALNHPPTLYTGGADGSILWWNLSNSDSHSEIKPIAILCGHAALIADLGICCPVVVSGEQNTHYSSNVALNSSFDHDGALISACTDSMLCVWSRSSGHCRRRRKLPPWVGSPSIIRTLPWNPRYACVGCCFINAAHFSDHHWIESAEGGEISMDKESQNRKPPKCTVVIVDTHTLIIVQTVFHGNLSIGPLKFMDVVSSVDNGEKHFSLMADSFGKLQLVPLSNNSHQGGKGETGLQRNSSEQEIETWEDGLVEAGQCGVIEDRTERPWSDCFLSVGEDSCVALTSFETLRVERMFPGHPNYPAKVVWDGARGYIACLCRDHSRISDATDVLYIWDVKTGARERVLRGTASHSMFDHFCKEISMTSISGSLLSGNPYFPHYFFQYMKMGVYLNTI
ncbi:hypothetical protein CRYUN_Cryun07bG0149400 [Craigia yunnanensis]